MEKNTGSCAIKIIQEKTFPRIFQSQETDGKLLNSWGAAVHHAAAPSQPSILERSYSFYGSCQARALSPNYFCKKICFPMNGGGKQNQCLRLECVILGTDVVGVLSPISLTDNSLNKWKQVKRYLISVKYYCTHTHTHCEALVHLSHIVAPPERNIFWGNNSWCTFENASTVNWLSTFSRSCDSLHLRQGSLLHFNMRSLILIVSCLSELIRSTFQIVQLSNRRKKRKPLAV